jgi:transcriptional regulator with XRE-family HTH domain
VSINERLKILISALNISARAFSQTIEVSESTTRNYLDKGTKPSTDYLERIASHFTNVNLTWLITGNGEPLIGEMPPVTNTTTTQIKKVSGGAVHSGTGNQLITLEACQQELEQTKRTAADLKKENEFLRAQLDTKDALIASKEETIDLLKSALNRPN